MPDSSWLWVLFTLVAAAAQTARNATQRELTATLGTVGADDFEIDEFYRFEGQSNPSDMSIVYGISSPKYKLKGVLVNAYGTYANDSSSAIEAKLHHNQVSTKLHGSDRPVS